VPPTTTVERLLRAARRSAVHLEMRDGYTPNDPALQAWLDGHRYRTDDRATWWRPWLDLVVEVTNRGVELRRARIVSEPVSTYIRYEYDTTYGNVRAGEQVRWLPRRLATDLLLPGNDFWLFDSRTLLINHFTGDGDATEPELVNDPTLAAQHGDAFESVWQRAVPHDSYRLS